MEPEPAVGEKKRLRGNPRIHPHDQSRLHLSLSIETSHPLLVASHISLKPNIRSEVISSLISTEMYLFFNSGGVALCWSLERIQVSGTSTLAHRKTVRVQLLQVQRVKVELKRRPVNWWVFHTNVRLKASPWSFLFSSRHLTDLRSHLKPARSTGFLYCSLSLRHPDPRSQGRTWGGQRSHHW